MALTPAKIKHKRTSTAGTAFPTLQPGELAWNSSQVQVAIGKVEDGTPLAILAVRFFSDTATYAVGDFIVRSGVLLRSTVAQGPSAFNGANWASGSAGLPEAPIDGVPYFRKDGAWVVVTAAAISAITDAPNNASSYVRQGAAWIALNATGVPYGGSDVNTALNAVSATLATKLGDAPSDSTMYVRRNGVWFALPAYLSDAPNDGTTYARKNAAWIALPSSFLADAASDGSYYARRNAAWSALPANLIGDAAGSLSSDGNYYVRRNTAWAALAAGATAAKASQAQVDAGTDDTTFVTPQKHMTNAIARDWRMKNYLRNPTFIYAQRGNPVVNPVTTQFVADGWQVAFGGGTNGTFTSTVSQTITADQPPSGTSWQVNSGAQIRLNRTVAGTATSAWLYTTLNDARILSNKTVTLSFNCYSVTGWTWNTGAIFRQMFGTGGSPSANVDTIFGAGTVIPAATWTRVSFTINVPSIAAKTIGSNNDSRLEIYLPIPPSATFDHYFSDAQLEEGPFMTPFERLPYEYLLPSILRYYQRVTYSIQSPVTGFLLQTVSFFPMNGSPTLSVAAAGSISAMTLSNEIVMSFETFYGQWQATSNAGAVTNRVVALTAEP